MTDEIKEPTKITPKEFLRKSEHSKYVKDNIAEVTLILGSEGIINAIDKDDRLIISGILEYNNQSFAVMYSIKTDRTFLQYLIGNPRRAKDIVDIDTIVEEDLYQLILAKVDECNLRHSLTFVNILSNQIDNEQILYGEETYAMLRTAINLIREDKMKLEDLSAILYSEKSKEEKYNELKLIVESRQR